MVRRELRRLEGDPVGCGFRVAAGGRGECPLLLRLDGTLREVAGGPAKGSGWSDWLSGDCGEKLERWLISGQKVVQVFVVEFWGCDKWLGLMFGASGR